MNPDLIQAATDAVARLHALGVAGAATAWLDDGWSIQVRDGAVETVRASTSRGLSVTAWAAEGRTGAARGTDPAQAAALAEQAAALARQADPDPWAGPAPAEACGLAPVDGLDDPGWAAWDPDAGIRAARTAEAAARARDTRANLTEAATARGRRGTRALATTAGVRLSWSDASGGASLAVVARDGDERHLGWAGTAGRRRDRLRDPAVLGIEAATRAVEGFGWKPMPTGPVPVVLDREVAEDLLGILAHGMTGGQVYRNQSWLAGRLGQPIANPLVTLIDDPTEPAGPGSRPCDGEGVRSAPRTMVEGGVLASWFTDAYSARRLGVPLTGHSGGCSNLRLVPGAATRDDLIRAAGDGLLVTRFNGWGVDLVAGTFSRGAEGHRIEHGRLTHPVQEVTVSGRLDDLFQGIRAIANDPDPESAVRCPSLLIDGFTIGGR